MSLPFPFFVCPICSHTAQIVYDFDPLRRSYLLKAKCDTCHHETKGHTVDIDFNDLSYDNSIDTIREIIQDFKEGRFEDGDKV